MATSLFAPGTNVPVRLLQQLDGLRERKVALLTATAGSGKSALARTWIESDPALDSRSFAVIVPGMDEHSADRIRAEVAQLDGPEPVLLLIDHHDRISDHALLGGIVDLAEADPRVRIILAGRMRPDVPLSALAIRGQLLEISTQDLALTEDEQRELLSRQTPSLDDELLAAIIAEYAGWPIAIELLANTELTSASMTSARTLIDSYLREEILVQIADDDMALLMALSALPDFSPSAAAQLTGRPDATARLTYLAAKGLPVEWLPNNRARFNPALRDYLARRLAESPEQHLEVNRRTARWLQQEGHPEEAIRRAAAAHDGAQLGDLVTRYLMQVLPYPRDDTEAFLSEVLGPLPDQFLRQLAQLALLGMRQPELMPVATIAAVEREHHEHLTEADRARLYTMALFVARQRNYQRHTDLVERALEYGDAVAAGLDTTQLGQLEVALLMSEYGTYHLLSGDSARADRALSHAVTAARLSGVEWLTGWGLGLLAYVNADLGRVPAANRLAQESLAVLRRRDLPEHFAEEPALLALLTCAVDRGRLAEADALWQTCPSMVTLLPMGMGPERAVIETDLALLRDDASGAVRGLKGFLSTNPTLTAEQRARIALGLAQSHLRLGLTAEAERDIAVLEGSAVTSRGRNRVALMRARLALAQGRPELAVEILDARMGAAGERQRNKTWLNMLMTYGVAANATGQAEAALEAFQSAGVLAESLGLNSPNARHTQVASSLHPDELRLTSAERNVLAHLAGGAKLGEIAEALYISPNTLKTHLRRIYRKLNVSDRNEAVARARTLGLRVTPTSPPSPN